MTTEADELREAVALAATAELARQDGVEGTWDLEDGVLASIDQAPVDMRSVSGATLSATALYLRANARSLAQHDDTADAWVEKIIGLIEEAGHT